MNKKLYPYSLHTAATPCDVESWGWVEDPEGKTIFHWSAYEKFNEKEAEKYVRSKNIEIGYGNYTGGTPREI